MIYLTAFSRWEYQFSSPVMSIAKYPPKSHYGAKVLNIFVPDWGAIQKYKKSGRSADWDEYVERYRQVCRSRWGAICRWLEGLQPEIDETLCSWEWESVRCHRSLVAKIVGAYRPECYGGLDVRNPNRQEYVVQRVAYRVELVQCGSEWSFRVRAPGSFPYDFGAGRTLSEPYPDRETAWSFARKFLEE